MPSRPPGHNAFFFSFRSVARRLMDGVRAAKRVANAAVKPRTLVLALRAANQEFKTDPFGAA